MPVYLDKIAFTHIPKCGGTSVTDALEQYAIDVLNEQGIEKYLGEVRFYRKHESMREIKGYCAELYGNNECFDNMIKFSVMRNPVDRVLSWLDYRKRTYSEYLKNPDFPQVYTVKYGAKKLYDPLGSAQPLLTQEEYDTGENCHHWVEVEEIEKFLDLSFHDYIHQATVWKHSGCEAPDCPYHLLPPQVEWLKDEDGTLAVDALFRLEDIGEVNKFLPDLPKIKKINSGTKSIIDYRKQLTEDSLRVILDYYAQDFELYSLLKKEQEGDDDMDGDPPQSQDG